MGYVNFNVYVISVILNLSGFVLEFLYSLVNSLKIHRMMIAYHKLASNEASLFHSVTPWVTLIGLLGRKRDPKDEESCIGYDGPHYEPVLGTGRLERLINCNQGCCFYHLDEQDQGKGCAVSVSNSCTLKVAAYSLRVLSNGISIEVSKAKSDLNEEK